MKRAIQKIRAACDRHWTHVLTTLHIGYFGFVVEHSHGPLVIIASVLCGLGILSLLTGREF